MPKKRVIFFKSIGRKWFIILVIIIFIVFIYNQTMALWLTTITLFLFLLSYFPQIFFNTRLLLFMKGYYMIEEDTIAQKLKQPIHKIRERMYHISQNQLLAYSIKKHMKLIKRIKLLLKKKKKWLIIFYNKRYIYFHKETIVKFIDFHNKGFGEKEMLEKLKDNDLRMRAEVKIIRDTLIKHNRLKGSQISVKEHQEKEKYSKSLK